MRGKSRNSQRLSGGGVGAQEQLTRNTNRRKSCNQIQTLKHCVYCHIYFAHLGTARSLEDETRNACRNANRNPEWLICFGQLQIQIKPKSGFEFVPQDTEEFKFKENFNSNLYHEIPRNLIFSILTSWLKSPQHSWIRFAFRRAFRVSSSRERAVPLGTKLLEPAAQSVTGSPGTLVVSIFNFADISPVHDRCILAGQQRRLTGHRYLRNKLSHRDVSSCRFFLWRKGLSPLHADEVFNTYARGRRGWEGVRVHIGPHWAERVGRAPPRGGVGQGLV